MYNVGMYIEFVIADNFTLTLLAGACASRLCHKRVNVWRLIAAAAVGTGVALFYPFVTRLWAQIAIKCALFLLLSFILHFRTKKPITSSVMFLFCTFALGGSCYALGLIICGSASGAMAFCKRFPLFLALGGGAFTYVCGRAAAKRLSLLRARAPYEYMASVRVFGRTLWFDAFLDTGNCVVDGVTGLPVVITDAERLTDKLDGAAAVEFIKSVDRFRHITVRTPAGESAVYIIKPETVTVYSDKRWHKIDVVLGLTRGGSERGALSRGHELLLGPAAVEGVK